MEPLPIVPKSPKSSKMFQGRKKRFGGYGAVNTIFFSLLPSSLQSERKEDKHVSSFLRSAFNFETLKVEKISNFRRRPLQREGRDFFRVTKHSLTPLGHQKGYRLFHLVMKHHKFKRTINDLHNGRLAAV